MPILTAILSIPSTGWTLFQQGEPLTFDQPVGDLPIIDDARWSAAFTGNSWGAFLAWVVLLIVLQAVSWPLVRRIFTRLPDRGWAFARTVSILLSGYAVWLLASIQLIAFRAIWAAIAIGALGLLSWIVSKKIPMRESEPPIKNNPIAITSEVIFWLVFGLFLLFRAINPDSYHLFWGGEKAMEFAHINAILRSAHFPPVDPWYSGGFINYYYYGTYLVAFLIKLTGIPVEFAFNLAQPTFPALLASTSFSMTAALGRRITGSTFGAWISGILGMFFVQFAGNFIVAERVIDRALNGLGPVNTWVYWLWEPTRAIPDPAQQINITEFPYFGALYADLHPHVIAMPFTILILALAWQIASVWRAVPLIVVGRSVTRHEFMSVITPCLIAALALGSLFMTNAWDMPMFAIIAAVSAFMLTLGMPGFWRRAGLTASIVGSIGLVALLVTTPFNRHYVALFSEIDTVRDRSPLLSIESHLGMQLLLVTFGMAALMLPRSGFSRATQTAIGVAAPLMLGFFLFLQWQAHRAEAENQRFAEFGVIGTVVGIWLFSAWAASNLPRRTGPVGMVARVAIPAVALIVIVLLAFERQTLALYVGIGLSAAVMWLTLRRPSGRFLAMLIAGATLLGASLEVVYLVDNLAGGNWYRMNTVFKFYNQIWNLLGIATGVVVGNAVWHTLVYTDEPVPGKQATKVLSRVWTWLTVALLIPVTFASLAYAVVATPIRLDTRFTGATGLTLNAYSWMEYGEIPLTSTNGEPLEPLRYADDLEAITWLNERVDGTPVIAEAAFGAYRCNGSRFSIATGLPAVVGWVNHETQQRDAADLWVREADLRELYTSTDSARQEAIIDQYNVEYVILGQTERHYPTIGNGCVDTGSPEGIASLESLAGNRLEIAFQSGSTTIYRVIRD
jgi:YYY domain-containing protein